MTPFDDPEPGDDFAAVMREVDEHLRGARTRIAQVANSDADLAVRSGLAVAANLEDRLDDLIEIDKRFQRLFAEHQIGQLLGGLDLLTLQLMGSQHVSALCIAEFAPDERGPRLEALIELHAHSILVANETVDLLRSGWPAGAEARWRTLHEIEVIALFIAKSPVTVARRYLASLDLDLHRRIERKQMSLPRTKEGAVLRKELKHRADVAIKKHGHAVGNEYGWACRWLRTKRVRFVDLERSVAKQTRRPAYLSASSRIHAGRIGSLGSILDTSGHVLTGRRAERVADVALQTAWSANNVVGQLLIEAARLSPDSDYLIWDEALGQLTIESDIELRRGEATRLIELGRNDAAAQYLPSVGTNLDRMFRDALRLGE